MVYVQFWLDQLLNPKSLHTTNSSEPVVRWNVQREFICTDDRHTWAITNANRDAYSNTNSYRDSDANAESFAITEPITVPKSVFREAAGDLYSRDLGKSVGQLSCTATLQPKSSVAFTGTSREHAPMQPLDR